MGETLAASDCLYEKLIVSVYHWKSSDESSLVATVTKLLRSHDKWFKTCSSRLRYEEICFILLHYYNTISFCWKETAINITEISNVTNFLSVSRILNPSKGSVCLKYDEHGVESTMILCQLGIIIKLFELC